MKQSIYQVVTEHGSVLATRKNLQEMFSMIAKCHVTIGGSYMLKYWCEAFADREVSDYDFIVNALPEDAEKLYDFLSRMNYLTGWLGTRNYYPYKSFYMGYLHGKAINVIIKPGKYCPCNNFERLEDIMNIKKAWCERALNRGEEPRYKDVEDIATYEQWQKEGGDLPF